MDSFCITFVTKATVGVSKYLCLVSKFIDIDLSSKKLLTLKNPFISESSIEIKIELNFYFHTSLWCLKRFYEGLKEV